MTVNGMTPRRVVVLGLGNPDRGDDGVGAIVAGNLVGRLPADVEILTRSGDMLSLVEDWTAFEAAVCIDASASNGAPGRIHRVDLTSDALPREIALASSHAFGLADAVDLARVLRCAPKRIVVYAIEGRCFEGGAPLSQEVAAAVAAVVEQVVVEVDRLRYGETELQSDA
jgi:hydrogenase maturation protease